MGKYDHFRERIQNLIFIAEVVLSFFIIAGVFLGTIDLVKYLIIVYKTPPGDAYEVFKQFLGHVLLLIIGLEFIVMLVKHSFHSLLEVLTFAIARKMIISAEEFTEVLMGILALAGLYAIRKFLYVNED